MNIRILLAAALAIASARPAPAQQAAQTPPSFRSGIEALPVDVTVVDGRGEPVRDLVAEDFTVKIDGQRRRIASAQWVASDSAARTANTVTVAEGYTSNETSAGGRLILLVIDQPNISFGNGAMVRKMTDPFIDRLSPADRVAVVGIGLGSWSTAFTANREAVKSAVERMPGQQQSESRGRGAHEMGLGTAAQIDRGDTVALEQMVRRDCAGNQRAIELCRNEIRSEATDVLENARRDADMTLASLRDLLNGLKPIDSSKTMIFVSQGFFMDQDRDGSNRVTEIAALAAAARTSIYALRLAEDSVDVTRSKASMAPFEDSQERRAGLETLAGAARGALFNVVGSGTGVFDRIASELAGYYLLAVEAAPRDKDRKPHPVQVEVTRRGLTVRARRAMLTSNDVDVAARSPREAVTAALSAPLIASSLTLRGIAFAFRGLEPSKVRLLIHADVGANYTSPQRMSVAYAVVDRTGRVLEGHVSEARMAPIPGSPPSSLAFSVGASVDPGDYTIKLAVADGDRIGTLELPVHASLLSVGTVQLTELIAGGPVPPGNLLRPTVGSRIAYGMVHGYLEAYGTEASTLGVTFEIAADIRGPAILSADVPARVVADDRVIFAELMPVNSLPPGSYRLRAMVRSSNGTLLTTLTRAFDIDPPAPAAAPVLTSDAAPEAPAGPLYLPVDAKDLALPFNRDRALLPETLEAFEDLVTPESRPAFDEGVAALRKADFKNAELSFKRAIRPDVDSTAGLAYLGVTFAASGHDAEAASAWRTTLAGAEDLPQIFDWLGEALIRRRAYGEARPILEEAVERWPSNTRFARSLALVQAIFGKGQEAARLMDRFLAENPDDAPSLFLAVQWLFNVHRAGAVVHNHEQDLQQAHAYADRYLKAGGLNQPLMKQWLAYLDKEKP